MPPRPLSFPPRPPRDAFLRAHPDENLGRSVRRVEKRVRRGLEAVLCVLSVLLCVQIFFGSSSIWLQKRTELHIQPCHRLLRTGRAHPIALQEVRFATLVALRPAVVPSQKISMGPCRSPSLVPITDSVPAHARAGTRPSLAPPLVSPGHVALQPNLR